MNSKILDDVRKLVGIHSTADDFDTDLVIHTNSVLFAVEQMGIGDSGFSIISGNEKWEDFLDTSQYNLTALKSYVALKVRMLFDPPTSSIVKQALDENLKELEWRIYITENYVGEI